MRASPRRSFSRSRCSRTPWRSFCGALGVALMVAFVKVPLGHVADPTDTSFTPRPEWYFLFLFQMLKLFQGPLEFFGAVVLPGLAVGALILMPFIDRGKMLKITQRTGAITLVGAGGDRLDRVDGSRRGDHAQADRRRQYGGPAAMAVDPGGATGGHRGVSRGALRGLPPVGAKPGGSGSAEGGVREAQRLVDGSLPTSRLCGRAQESNLPTAQLRALVELVTKRGDDAIEAWKTAPAVSVQGAEVYQANQCSMCHTLNGEGGKVGPVLNGVSSRHDRAWVLGHFSDPEQYSPGSQMPPFDDLSSRIWQSLTDYVLAIPK